MSSQSAEEQAKQQATRIAAFGLAGLLVLIIGCSICVANTGNENKTSTSTPATRQEVNRDATNSQNTGVFRELVESCEAFHASVVKAKERGLTYNQMVEAMMATGATAQQVQETADTCAVVLGP